MKRYHIAVVGGGVLGAAIAYFAAFLNPDKNVALIEREDAPARHTSGRNTGKVHAPYLYDPRQRGLFARSALVGYSMWRDYARTRRLPFREDGVIEVAMDADQANMLDRHREWGIRNGLDENDLTVLDGRELRRAEPEVRCHAALVCERDASADYRSLTERLVQDAVAAGAEFLPRREVTAVSQAGDHMLLTLNRSASVSADFVVNAAGGRSIRLARLLGVAAGYSNLYFRGEYWLAPASYHTLTSRSVYSVPTHPGYPFLDPHWIVRVDGSCEVGPNATPVFSPFGYDAAGNLRHVLPKALELLGSGARHMLANPEFRRLAASELYSSLSKRHMVGRVARFIPRLDHAAFSRRGTAGIRAQAVDRNGSFVSDVMVLEGPRSIHVLNYNSPGATGALPFAVHILRRVASSGMCRMQLEDAACGPWTFGDVPHI